MERLRQQPIDALCFYQREAGSKRGFEIAAREGRNAAEGFSAIHDIATRTIGFL